MRKVSILIVSLLFAPAVFAHISIVSGPHYANSYSQFDFAVPHGCEGFDTLRLEMTLPQGLTGVRPIDGVFGAAVVERDENNAPTKITWTKSYELYETDSHAYTLSLRAKTPDAPFTTIHFPTIQVCLDEDGNEIESAWVGTSGHHHGGDNEELPAPSVLLNPPRKLGWNNYFIDQHLHDLSIFDDAEIVWMDSAAYSSNAHTMELILLDDSAQVLEMIHPGSEIWVKY